MRRGFTLIELLVTIAIIAILSVVVILTLNPAQLLKQSRDSSRLSDLQVLNTAIGTLQADNQSSSIGSSSVVYISIADATTTCADLGLPALASGWSYHCAPTSTLRQVGGTGWVPIDFTSISFGAPLSSLPIDPVNSTSSGNFYTYVKGWEFTSAMESAKQQASNSAAANDGGVAQGVLEKGTNLTVTPPQVVSGGRDSSLVAYWPLDDGSGSSVQDVSGNAMTGTFVDVPTWTIGCKVGDCLSFEGTDDGVSAAYKSGIGTISSQITLMAWVKPNAGSLSSRRDVLNHAGSGNYWWFNLQNSGKLSFYADNITGGVYKQSTGTISEGVWSHIAVTYTGSAINFYINGSLDSSIAASGSFGNDTTSVDISDGNGRFAGLIDDVRVYNRALSAAEISAIYRAVP